MKRLFDIVFAGTALILASPLLLLGVALVRAGSPGPILYRAARVGRGGVPFSMLKFRTMHVGSDRAGAITGPGDRRVFAAGRFLRAAKIDELPQFINILRGDMSVVGPRPEDPGIVARDYAPWMHETLRVRPGVTSPGAVFGYLEGEALLDPEDPDGSYAAHLLPLKLAVEQVYLARATFLSDLTVIVKTALAIGCSALRLRAPLVARDLTAARAWLATQTV